MVSIVCISPGQCSPLVGKALLICVCLALLIAFYRNYSRKEEIEITYANDNIKLHIPIRNGPTVFIANISLTNIPESEKYAVNMASVFRRLGYHIADSIDEEWDLMWLLDVGSFVNYAKRLLGNIKPYQAINMYPGNRVVTNKTRMHQYTFPFVPKTFKMPQEKALFLEYAAKNPNQTFVHKTEVHKGRGVKIGRVSELKNVENYRSSIQVFIDNPFLIDGRKFDIQVYTSMSSVNPLRIYIQTTEYSIRFCPQDFHPFDPNIPEKYVVFGDNTIFPWMDDIPTLQRDYFKHSLTNKAVTFSYLESKGISKRNVEKQIEEAVYSVLTRMEDKIEQEGKRYIRGFDNIKMKRHFFQLIRFDFVLDENGKLWLIEINSTPAMSFVDRPEKRLQVDRTFYSFLSLNGWALPTRRHWAKSVQHEQEMIVSDRDISTFTDQCRSNACDNNCQEVACQLCTRCLDEHQKAALHRAYVAHTYGMGWKRIVPREFKTQETADSWVPEQDTDFLKLQPSTQWLTRWFWGKCLQEKSWC